MPIDTSRLQVSLEEGERWRRTLNITVPAEIVQAERKAAVRKLSSRVRLPGFRTGKVPASVVEKRFGPAIERELVDRVIGETYREVLRSRDLRPISEGEVGDIDYAPSSDLAFSISFEVAPSVSLQRVGGFRVERPSVPVRDEDVDAVIDRLSEQQGTWVPLEDGSPEDGDLVGVTIFRLEDDGSEPESAEPSRYELTLGKGEAIPDVETAIRSLELGAEGEFTVTFPENFPDEDRRGDEERLRVRLESLKRLERPALDDEFARQVGDFDSVEALRTRVREDLEKEASDEAEGAVRATLLGQILEANPFEIPDAMVDQYIRSAMGDAEELTAEQLSELREQFRPQAERTVKRFLVIDEVARSRELQATEEEIEERVQEIAERSGTGPGEVYARLQRSGALERLEREITERKVFEFLESESTVTDAD